MKSIRIKLLAFTALVTIGTLGCAPVEMLTAASSPTVRPPLVVTKRARPEIAKKANPKKLKAAVTALNTYSAKKYREVAQQAKGNLVLSPLGPFLLDQMLYESSQGASEKTLAQDLKRADYGTAELSELCWQLSANPSLVVKNALFVEPELGLREAATRKLTAAFDVTAESRPLGSDPEAANRYLDGWVTEATQGRYTSLPTPVDPQHTIVLLSTLVFQDRWTSEFSPEETKPAPFHLSDGTTVEVPTMEKQESHSVQLVKVEQGDGVALSFWNGAELVFLLPPPGVSPDQLLEKLEFPDAKEYPPVTLYLPRFEFEAPTIPLSRTTIASADLKPLLANPGEAPLLLNTYQKAKVRVDEVGAEAAVVTELMATPAGAMSLMPPKILRFDRPFAFVLRDRETGAVLLTGRVENPLEKS